VVHTVLPRSLAAMPDRRTFHYVSAVCTLRAFGALAPIAGMGCSCTPDQSLRSTSPAFNRLASGQASGTFLASLLFSSLLLRLYNLHPRQTYTGDHDATGVGLPGDGGALTPWAGGGLADKRGPVLGQRSGCFALPSHPLLCGPTALTSWPVCGPACGPTVSYPDTAPGDLTYPVPCQVPGSE
jgi:hypothetical protein